MRAWCARHDLPSLPGSGQDVAAFLAGERGRKLAPETLKLRRAAIRYLHRAVLLVGFAGALRRSEIAAIRFGQLERTDRDIRLTLPRTKGEQSEAVTGPAPQ